MTELTGKWSLIVIGNDAGLDGEVIVGRGAGRNGVGIGPLNEGGNVGVQSLVDEAGVLLDIVMVHGDGLFELGMIESTGGLVPSPEQTDGDSSTLGTGIFAVVDKVGEPEAQGAVLDESTFALGFGLF